MLWSGQAQYHDLSWPGLSRPPRSGWQRCAFLVEMAETSPAMTRGAAERLNRRYSLVVKILISSLRDASISGCWLHHSTVTSLNLTLRF
jgi:hypothetical protein